MIATKDKYIQHLTLMTNQIEDQSHKTEELTNQKYKEMELVANENYRLKQEIEDYQKKLDEALKSINNMTQCSQEDRKNREKTIEREIAIKEDKWKKTIAQEKENSLQSVHKIKSNFHTKERLMKKVFKKSCADMKEEIEKLKISIQKEMLIFMKLFTRDIKKMVEEGKISEKC